MTRDDVNQVLGNILSINPDLISIISTIASDLGTLDATFVAKTVYNQYVADTDQRLDDLETIDDNTLYLNPNTGEVSIKVAGNFESADISSYQIMTKYKIDDDPQQTVVYNLED